MMDDRAIVCRPPTIDAIVAETIVGAPGRSVASRAPVEQQRLIAQILRN